MAIRKSVLQFEGQIGGMNAYLPKNRKEEDGYILRKNGGPTAKQIAKLPSCVQVRENNELFGSSSSLAKKVRMAISPLQHLADVNLAARFTALCRQILIQENEGQADPGLKSFADSGYMISGFSLNQLHLFDSVVRHPLTATLHRDKGQAEIVVPVLQPGVSLVLPWQKPLYRLIFSLCTVGERNPSGFQGGLPAPVSYITPWYIAQQRVEMTTVTLQLEKGAVDEMGCMILGVGIEMGTMLSDAVVTPAKHMGCGKILLAG